MPTAAGVETETPKKMPLPKGRQPPSYDDAVLRGYLQAQWDAHRRLPTYAELQRGDPENESVPRFAGSLTRLVRLRRAFLAEVDPTSSAASQHRLARVEKAVEKNTDRTDHAIELIEETQLGEAVKDLLTLADTLRLQINTRDVRSTTLANDVTSLRNELRPLLQAFEASRSRSKEAPTPPAVRVPITADTTPESSPGVAEQLRALTEVLETLKAGQQDLAKLMKEAGGRLKDREDRIDSASDRLTDVTADIARKLQAVVDGVATATQGAASIVATDPGLLQSSSFNERIASLEMTLRTALSQSSAAVEHRMLTAIAAPTQSLAAALSHLAESQIAQVDVMEAETAVILEALEQKRPAPARTKVPSKPKKKAAPRKIAPRKAKTKVKAKAKANRRPKRTSKMKRAGRPAPKRSAKKTIAGKKARSSRR